jgi:tetratricopeptide (TPR) repeat protein
MPSSRIVRPLAVLILLAMTLGTHHLLHAQSAGLRTVTVRVAPDETYRAQANWQATLRNTVATVSDIYEKAFQIRFVILDIVPWTAGPSGGPQREGPQRLMNQMMAAVPVGEADVLVGFSNRCERLTYGWAQVFHRVAMVTTGCYETLIFKDFAPEPVVLSHELAHLFGVFHPMITVDSVMRGGPADRFDDQTTRTIRLMRDFDFKRGVMGVDQETRRAWSSIYAEGHARDEPNPLAMAIAGTGWNLLQSGKMAEGEAAIHEAIKVDPSFATPHRYLGFLFSRRGQLDDAVRELQAAKALDFRQVEARTELGMVLLRLGKDEEALWEFREVARVDPRFARAHVGLGMTLSRRAKLDEAISEYDEAIRLDPKDAAVFGNRGFAHAGKKDYDRAIRDYDEALRLVPNYVWAFSHRGSAYANKKDYDRAIQDYDEALRLDPKDASAFGSRGFAYRRKGSYDRAIRDYDQAILLRPMDAGFWNNRCFTRAIAGKLEEALADCNESLRLRADSAPALDSRGLTYLKLDQPGRAIADYDTALRLNPKSAHSLYGRSLAKRQMGDLAGAEADLAAANAISARIAEEYTAYGVRP